MQTGVILVRTMIMYKHKPMPGKTLPHMWGADQDLARRRLRVPSRNPPLKGSLKGSPGSKVSIFTAPSRVLRVA